MSIQLMETSLPEIAAALARKGLDLLSGVFRGRVDEGTSRIAAMIAEKTGIDVNDIADDKLTHEQWGKLKEFELARQHMLLEHRSREAFTNLQPEKLRMEDRRRTRNPQLTAPAPEDPFIRRFVYIYSLVITILTFGFIYYAAFGFHYEDSTQAVRIIDTVIGFLLGVSLSAIIQYFFGSSAGSKSKEERLKQLAG